ncbi:MAG: Crp/Fnr family transcriptional regulator, partial [Acinetobacter sp.]
ILNENNEYHQFKNLIVLLEQGKSNYLLETSAIDYRKMAEKILSEYKFMDFCTDHEKNYILNNLKIHHYFSGETIYNRNKVCDEAIFVLKGTIQMGWNSAEGKHLIHRFIPSGSLLNIIYLMSGAKLQHEYIAHEAVTLAKIPEHVFKEILNKNHKVLHHFFELICKRNCFLDNDIYFHHVKGLRAQLARQFLYFLEYFASYSNQNIVKLSIKLSQDNFADLLKTSRQSIRKEIAWFVQEGIIEAKYNQFLIKEPERLRTLI